MNQRQAVKMLLTGLMNIALIFCAPLFAATTANNTITVTSSLGKLKGTVNNNIATFYGVPYAKNPFVEGRRFQAPQAIKKWDGVLDATAIKQPVPQPSRGGKTTLVGVPGDLTINIWTPTSALTAKEKLPVMVWIPGGAFIRGDASEGGYDGSRFAQNEVIIVTVNYRVGVDGFMHLNGAPDNRGILDQILALQWVQHNITDFGGDSAQVTLFGQSAGAESVAILLGTKKANGLYHKAIMQSPPMQAITQQQAQAVTQHFAGKLNIPATIKGIASVPYPQLVATVIEMGEEITNRQDWGMLSWGGTAFLPVIDKDLIADTPMTNLQHNINPSIPVIVGSTDQEARLYMVPSGAIDRVNATQISLFLNDLALGDQSLTLYSRGNKDLSEGDIFANIQSDFTFRMPAIRIAEQLVKNGNNVWKYNFSWLSPAFGGRLGAAHFVDVPFVFNTTNSTAVSAFLGKHPPATLANEMHHQWAIFAKSGEANWTAYQPSKRTTMRFDVQSKQVNDPNKALRLLWQHYPF
ncbi:carboxylesterase/lipase family protein [Shewanella sp. A14]